MSRSQPPTIHTLFTYHRAWVVKVVSHRPLRDRHGRVATTHLHFQHGELPLRARSDDHIAITLQSSQSINHSACVPGTEGKAKKPLPPVDPLAGHKRETKSRMSKRLPGLGSECRSPVDLRIAQGAWSLANIGNGAAGFGRTSGSCQRELLPQSTNYLRRLGLFE